MSENKRLVACVTGASRGIGFAIAEQLAEMCSHLLIAARTEEHIVAASGRLETTTCNIIPMWGDLAQGQALAETAKSLLLNVSDKLDVLVLDAGYYVEGSLAEIAPDDFERNMLVNCHSAHYMVSALIPLLKLSSKPRIIIIGSTAAYEPYPLVPTYGIAKWGLRGYAINLRRELMQDGIGVTLLSPGGTLTDMWAGTDLPPGRLLDPTDIAKLVAASLLLSPQAVVEELIVRPMLGDIHE